MLTLKIQVLCPSLKISQWPPGSWYLMQKQESFYYQARAGAPTDTDSYREEPWALGYIAYIGYSRAKNSKNRSLRVWLVTFWWRVRCWVLIGFHFPGWPRVLIGSHFPGLIWVSLGWPRVLIGSQVVGWGQGISKGSWISKGSFPGTLQNGVA